MLDDESGTKVLNGVCNEVVATYVEFSFLHKEFPTGKDGMCSCAKKLLGLGLFYLEYHAAIKEGDGTRVLSIEMLRVKVISNVSSWNTM